MAHESEVTVFLPQGIYKGQQVDLQLGIQNGASLLPIELLDFKGRFVEENSSVELSWLTLNEENFSHFEIFKSAEGNAFEKIGEKKGSGQELAEYSFEDLDPVFGNNFYQLRMVDLDGQSSLSPIVEVIATNLPSPNIRLYPNPIKQDQVLRMEIYLPSSLSADMKLIDVKGQVVEHISQIGLDLQGKTWFELPMEGFAPGIYVLMVEGNAFRGEKIIRKFVLR